VVSIQWVSAVSSRDLWERTMKRGGISRPAESLHETPDAINGVPADSNRKRL
jgi:hypothetical protein